MRWGAGQGLLTGACLALTLLTSLAACRRATPKGGEQVSAPALVQAPEVVPETAAAVLAPSSPVDRVLHGGESHRFAIGLAEGQFLDLRIDQHDIDVIVALIGPLGEPLLEIDNPSGVDGTRGVERIVWIAETPGTYIAAIRSRVRKGAAGSYTIELEEPRPALALDHDRVVAEKVKAEADRLYGQGRLDTRQRAITRYEEALAGFLAVQDVPRQADARYRLGTSWRALGEPQRAFEEFAAALPLYEAVGNEPQQALCRHELCHLLVSRGELDSALDQCRAALQLWETVGDRLGLAATAQELGLVYRRLNEGHQAVTHYDRALDLSRELDRPAKQAQILHNRGRLYASLGQRAQALADLEGALAIRRRLGKESDIALNLNSLGLFHARFEELEKARENFEQALALRQGMDEESVGIALIGMGWATLEADEARSTEYFEQALEIFVREGSRAWQAQALLFLGRQASARNRLTRIPEVLTRALQLCEANQDLAGAAEVRLAIAEAMRRLGRLALAQEDIENAIEIIEDLRTRMAANLDQRANFFATKQAYYDVYVDLLMERHEAQPSAGFDAEALGVSERARARSLNEALSERRGGPRRKVDPALLAEEQRLERRISTRQAQIEAATTEPEALMAGLKAEQRNLLRRYEHLQGQIRLGSPHDADLTQPPLLSVEDIQRLIGPETLLLEYRLGESRSFLWAVTSDTITAVVLPPREEIERATRWLVGYFSHERQETATRSAGRARQALADSSRWLLAGVREQLGAVRRVVVVADGALQYLPFEALDLAGDGPSDVEPSSPLIAGLAEVVYLPSASTLAVLRRQLADRVPAPRLLAVMADPVFDTGDPRYRRPAGAALAPGLAPVRSGEAAELRRLTYTAREAEAILTLVPGESSFLALGFAASRDVLTSGELGRHRIVHLATHGELNAEHAELSRLVLSLFGPDGRPRDDGFLYAYEVYGLEIPAELVVLSACQTALGEQIRGEGLVGLTRGFMHAGAARVVVSLWRVEDEATAALMGHFYENLLVKKMAPAAALRAAKNWIRQQEAWRDPYFWAGFVFQGEWRDFQR